MEMHGEARKCSSHTLTSSGGASDPSHATSSVHDDSSHLAWVKEGYLVKLSIQGQGPLERIAVSYLGMRRWRRHWVRVRKGQLIYQLHESDSVPCRVINLISLGTTVRATRKRPYCFTLDFQSPSGRCLHLHMQAQDHADRNSWIEAIRFCIPNPWSAEGLVKHEMQIQAHEDEITDSEIIDELLEGPPPELKTHKHQDLENQLSQSFELIAHKTSNSDPPNFESVPKTSVSTQFEKIGTSVQRAYDEKLEIESFINERNCKIVDLKNDNDEISDEINSWWMWSEQERTAHEKKMAESRYRISIWAQQLAWLQKEKAELKANLVQSSQQLSLPQQPQRHNQENEVFANKSSVEGSCNHPDTCEIDLGKGSGCKCE